MEWTNNRLAFAKAPNEWRQIEHMRSSIGLITIALADEFVRLLTCGIRQAVHWAVYSVEILNRRQTRVNFRWSVVSRHRRRRRHFDALWTRRRRRLLDNSPISILQKQFTQWTRRPMVQRNILRQFVAWKADDKQWWWWWWWWWWIRNMWLATQRLKKSHCHIWAAVKQNTFQFPSELGRV